MRKAIPLDLVCARTGYLEMLLLSYDHEGVASGIPREAN